MLSMMLKSLAICRTRTAVRCHPLSPSALNIRVLCTFDLSKGHQDPPRDEMSDVQQQINKVEEAIKKVEEKIDGALTDKEREQLWDEKKRLRDEKKQLRDEKKQLRDKENILLQQRGSTQVVNDFEPRNLEALRTRIQQQGWHKRNERSTEWAQPLETAGWPLLDREQQLAQVLEITKQPMTMAASECRRVLCTQASPGSGKSRFLRTLAIGGDAIKRALVGQLDADVDEWTSCVLCIHLSFGNGSSLSIVESKAETHLLARRLLYSYYDCLFTSVQGWCVDLETAIELVLEESGKSQLLLCVDELAENPPDRAKSIVHHLADTQSNVAKKGKSLYALVSTLDSSVGVVKRTSTGGSSVFPLWIPLLPPSSSVVLPQLESTFEEMTEQRREEVKGALMECGYHMRSVEFIMKCLKDDCSQQRDMVSYTVNQLASMYQACLTTQPGALAFMVSSALSSRALPWDADGATKFVLNDFSNLLLNSRLEANAIPKPSANFLRVAVKREREASGRRDPDDTYVAGLLHLILNQEDRDITSSYSFEHFARRFFALRLHAFSYNDQVDSVSIKDFFCLDPDAGNNSTNKKLLDEHIVAVSPNLNAAVCRKLATGSEVTEGCVVTMPDRNPGFDVMALCKPKDGDGEKSLAMLIQVRYYMGLKVAIEAISEAHDKSHHVLASILEEKTVWSEYNAKTNKGRHCLAHGVIIPPIDRNKTLFVVQGTQVPTKYHNPLPERTIVVANDETRRLLGDIFNGTEHMLNAAWKSKGAT